ncbi:aminotransferase class III-fold pyridoxal phosphate-dependent enzyme [Streptomyces sp. RerS4]|uniref:aspartate aminotransferase family protein n=1 Tax=Streptomyces sp. RerS4 TaxID=2942449 RepID=UPI00201C1C37|nr:aminotransferase class III-fold pyridoxal phosphate-dependent enzyme [Streptomyces sp. RerS4]UQX05332.1 aminotransferase class III-fold pyridoxal phosphate-dependent enzyme [Streptomyces sp. RerS4]
MTTEPTTANAEFAEPFLLGVLASGGLDADYVRGEGNTLYRRGEDGQEIPVLDFVGGYGSLMLGHNNPEINAYAKELLDAQTPVHAQFSRHPYANDVAEVLNRILQRERGDDEQYYAIFANSGAEAVEAAMKHAELDRGLRLAALTEEISAHVEEVLTRVTAGEATVAPGVAASIEDLVTEVVARNEAQAARQPVFLVPEGGFHGKLAGSVQLTHNEGYRLPFKALAAQSRFVPRDQPGALRKIIDEERAQLLDLVVEGGQVQVVERDFPLFVAFVLEPVLGEGGIHELTVEFAREIQEVCAEASIPLVIDEVQTGMGRTGSFLAATRLGLRGDYYTLAKSLGGGIAKAAVMLVRKPLYHGQFELAHSSTFAKDSFSCFIALKVLEIMERGDGEVYRRAAERGEKLLAMLRAVRDDFPEAVKEVRGRGLMLGLEFHDQSDSASEPLRAVAQSGFFGYFVSGHILRAHRIRTFPTSSAVNTLRFEPSVYLTDEEIDRLEAALRDVCVIIRDTDGASLAPVA